LIRTSACPSAASTVAASLPQVQFMTTLFGALSCSCGAPGSVARLASTTTGSSS
jgi:hypothetical protein